MGVCRTPDTHACISMTEEELLTCRLCTKVVLGRAYADSDSGLL